MQYYLLGAATLFLAWWLFKGWILANPAKAGPMARQFGGWGLIGVAAILALRGRIDMAFLVGSAGGFLLGIGPWARRLGRADRVAGATSKVRSAYIAMELDHDTGEMRGQVLAGRFAGRPLAGLGREDFGALASECANDADSARLLEAYLDRRFPGWRETAHGHAHAGHGGRAVASPMSEQEAHEILGLQPGASEEDIRRAHRTLMKGLHPDKGGSTWIAAKVNEAKDVLLKRHA